MSFVWALLERWPLMIVLVLILDLGNRAFETVLKSINGRQRSVGFNILLPVSNTLLLLNMSFWSAWVLASGGLGVFFGVIMLATGFLAYLINKTRKYSNEQRP
jgi:hypothetical protein